MVSQNPLGNGLSAWERSGQTEPWEHAVVEAGDGADPIAAEGEDEETDPMADADRGAQVSPERRLPVGSRCDEVKPPARAEDAGAEAGHDLSALVFERHWGHRDEDVVGQKRHKSVEISGLVRVDELRHDCLLG